MTPEEVIDVLTKLAAYDQRTVGEADVMAWHEILRRTDLGDALDAVRRHYSETSQRAMPADILKMARVARDDRKRLERKAEPLALPSRFETDLTRDERVREGVQHCREVLAPILNRLAERRAGSGDGQAQP